MQACSSRLVFVKTPSKHSRSGISFFHKIFLANPTESIFLCDFASPQVVRHIIGEFYDEKTSCLEWQEQLEVIECKKHLGIPIESDIRMLRISHDNLPQFINKLVVMGIVETDQSSYPHFIIQLRRLLPSECNRKNFLDFYPSCTSEFVDLVFDDTHLTYEESKNSIIFYDGETRISSIPKLCGKYDISSLDEINFSGNLAFITFGSYGESDNSGFYDYPTDHVIIINVYTGKILKVYHHRGQSIQKYEIYTFVAKNKLYAYNLKTIELLDRQDLIKCVPDHAYIMEYSNIWIDECLMQSSVVLHKIHRKKHECSVVLSGRFYLWNYQTKTFICDTSRVYLYDIVMPEGAADADAVFEVINKECDLTVVIKDTDLYVHKREKPDWIKVEDVMPIFEKGLTVCEGYDVKSRALRFVHYMDDSTKTQLVEIHGVKYK